MEAICFTHCHADHTAGLPGLLLTIGNSGRREPLTLIGPEGLGGVVAGLTVIAPELPFELRVVEHAGGQPGALNIAGVDIDFLPVEHGVPCLAYSFTLRRAGRFDAGRARAAGIPLGLWKRLQSGLSAGEGGRLYTPEMVLGPGHRGIKVSYCTDARPDDRLAGFIAGSDLFICEGLHGDEALREKAAEKKHMVFSEAAGLALKGGCGELWLTHFSPALTQPELFLGNATDIFANTLCGRDLMTKTLNFAD